MSTQPTEPVERYVPITLTPGGRGTFTCLDCGGLTLDRIIHDQWHHNLADEVASVVIQAVVEASLGRRPDGS